MKIVVMSSHTPSLFWFRMDMMQSFIELGHKVYAFGNEPLNEWYEKFSKKDICYRQIYVQRNGINPLADIRTYLSIKNELKSIMPDKIFTFQAKTVIYGGIAANQIGITEVYPLIAGMGSVFLNNNFKTRIIRMIMKKEYDLGMRNCPVIFFQNHDDEDIFRSCGIIKNQNIQLLHGSGVNIEHFRVTPFPNQFGFLCISRLIKDKGIFEYLEAAKIIKIKYPNIRCMLVGPFDSNPSAIRLEQLKPYIELGIEYFGEQSDVRPYISQCNVFVLPSYREGTPKTVLEAMACGRAIITTNAPGCKETVINNKNGYLIRIKNIEQLVEKMEYLINNPLVVENMGKASRQIAEKLFDVKCVNKTICKSMKLY